MPPTRTADSTSNERAMTGAALLGEALAQRLTRRELLHGFARRFVNRWDWYALQQRDGSYRAVHQHLTYEHVRRHLRGEITLGVYALDAQSQARWVCFDADDPSRWQAVLAVHAKLKQDGVAAALEHSRRGGHLWLFLAEPLPGSTVRTFARALLDEDARVEIFPKQDHVQDGPGSLVRLPLGVHRKSGRRYFFHQPQCSPAPTLTEQLRAVAAVPPVPTAYVAAVLADAAAPARRRPPVMVTPTASQETGLVARIKRELDISAVVGQVVDLTPSGRGHCPFHDDTPKSFSVNRAGGYFNCFAGCGGGDVITFWERYRRIPQAQAIRELASQLPKTQDTLCRQTAQVHRESR